MRSWAYESEGICTLRYMVLRGQLVRSHWPAVDGRKRCHFGERNDGLVAMNLGSSRTHITPTSSGDVSLRSDFKTSGCWRQLRLRTRNPCCKLAGIG